MRGYEFRGSLGRGRTGAVLHLPDRGNCEDWDGDDAEATKDHLKRYAEIFLKFAEEKGVKKIILVTGFTVGPSWAAAAFLAGDIDLELSQPQLQWRVRKKINGDLDYHASPVRQVCLSWATST